MPRGGKREPDDSSPYKTADGRDLELLKSSASTTGYLNVVKQHSLYYVKKKLDTDVPGTKKMKMFGKDGKGLPTARDAAIVLAEYLDSPYPLPQAPPRAPPGSRLTEEQKKEKRLAGLTAEAWRLLGVSEEEQEAEVEQDRADFEAWRATPPVVFDGPIVVVADVEPQPVLPQGTDAATLAQVRRIQAAVPARA